MDNLKPTVYSDQLILTTQQLADAYGADPKHIRDNFQNNKSRYTPGKHYYSLEGASLKTFKEAYPEISGNLKFAPVLYLWTKKGAFMHAKSLNTDKAWDVYEHLVDFYFEQTALQEGPSQDIAYLEALNNQLKEAEYRLLAIRRNARAIQKSYVNIASPQVLIPQETVKTQVQNRFARFWKMYQKAFSANDLRPWLPRLKRSQIVSVLQELVQDGLLTEIQTNRTTKYYPPQEV